MSQANGPVNPYHSNFDPSTPPPPTKKSRVGLILAILGGVGVLGLIACCGGGYAMMNFGFNIIGSQVTTTLRTNAKATEKLGEIKSCKMDFVASSSHPNNQKPGNPQQIMIFNVEGTKDSGIVTAEITNRPGQQEIRLIELRTSSGEVIPLGP